MSPIFSIIIPAYNEEAAVSDILRRSLAAAPRIREAHGLEDVEVILVDDGSRDRTGELARAVAGVRVLTHPVNRGYGAAIKTGFCAAKGDWLGFLDADGTCDPEFFIELLRLSMKEGADVALGSRLHPGSRMPWVRTLGNRVFRMILNFFSGGGVSDTASGMRVIRRSALERLYPLPDGLDFTPAMSVRAVLDPSIDIREAPMSYAERTGHSKLSVIRDGLRFLSIILKTAATYRPAVFFACAAGMLALCALPPLFFSMGGPSAPVPFYLLNGRIEDWMFFRLIFVSVLLGTAAFLYALGLTVQTMVDLIHRAADPFLSGSRRMIILRAFPWAGGASLLLALWVDRRPFAAYILTGHIPVPGQGQEFWVFPVVGGMFALFGLQLLALSALLAVSRMLWARESYRQSPAKERG
ncbi:MAG: glycosyltransferase family 2 protein [Elusimicrobiota bacterium]